MGEWQGKVEETWEEFVLVWRAKGQSEQAKCSDEGEDFCEWRMRSVG